MTQTSLMVSKGKIGQDCIGDGDNLRQRRWINKSKSERMGETFSLKRRSANVESNNLHEEKRVRL